MHLPEEGYLLRIFVGEGDKEGGLPLYEWITRRAKEEHLAGCTVLRGIESYGANSRIHTARILQLSMDLPIIIEVIDSLEKIENFMPILDSVMKGGLVTLEKIQIKLYRPKTN